MKKTLKLILTTLGMLAIFVGSIASISYATTTINRGIEFEAQAQIDDKYGKLDSNTRYVIEKTFKKVTKDTGFDFYFSYVFEELNDTYVLELSTNPKAVFVFYDDSENAINIMTNLEMKDDDFRKTLKEDDNLDDFIPNYMNSVKNSITEESNKVYVENMSGKFLIYLLAFIISFVVFASLFIPYIRYVKKSFKEIKDARIAKREQKLNCKMLKKQNPPKHSGDIEN